MIQRGRAASLRWVLFSVSPLGCCFTILFVSRCCVAPGTCR